MQDDLKQMENVKSNTKVRASDSKSKTRKQYELERTISDETVRQDEDGDLVVYREG